MTATTDDLHSHQPLYELLTQNKIHFFMICKEDSHQALYQEVELLTRVEGAVQTTTTSRWTGRYREQRTYRWVEQVPVKAGTKGLGQRPRRGGLWGPLGGGPRGPSAIIPRQFTLDQSFYGQTVAGLQLCVLTSSCLALGGIDWSSVASVWGLDLTAPRPQDDNSCFSWYHPRTMGQPHYVYIVTDEDNSVLYTGKTGDLKRRAGEHRAGRGSAYTRRTHARKLVYYEALDDAGAATAREKRIKAGTRQAKLNLIEALNPEWQDLYEEL